MARVVRGRYVTGVVDTTGLFSKHHSIDRWHREIAERVRLKAWINAPKRTGKMANSMTIEGPHRYGASGSEWTITVRRHYGRFVHEGTSFPIYSRRALSAEQARTARMGPTNDGRGPTWLTVVRGQKANPFMAEAVEAVGYTHGWKKGRTRAYVRGSRR